jgi:hypothetical protein
MSRLQPVGQKRLTNICIVRLKRNGKRFEVAAYRNTVVAWRNKVEKDIDEVLQVHTIYANLDKGVLAKSEDLIEAFGTDDEDKVCVEVLNRGEFQGPPLAPPPPCCVSAAADSPFRARARSLGGGAANDGGRALPRRGLARH